MIETLALLGSAGPCIQFFRNLPLYQSPPRGTGMVSKKVSVLIPARNEEGNIGPALDAVLLSQDVVFEVVVLDDHSTDRTAEIVRDRQRTDQRVRLELAPALPEGWCGKEHACHILAQHARHEVMVFVDADVRLAPGALASFVRFMEVSGVSLASGVPRQITGGLFERMMIPLIHFTLLCYLPFRKMRSSLSVGASAGCGQLFVALAGDYHRAGGHQAIWNRIHDGVGLPRSFRRAGFRTDLFDPTDLASCRMYERAGDVWSGLAKNATEAMATPMLIGPITVMLVAGHVLPWFVVLWEPVVGGLACLLSLIPRLVGVWRFRQPLTGALLHPFGISALVAIQWVALFNKLRGKAPVWKGRAFTAAQQ
jgi:hypothetical protein